MSLLSHLLHLVLVLGVKEENLGIFLVWRCPKCEAERDFDLIKNEGKTSLLGQPLGPPEILLDFRCRQCRYEMSVKNSEMEMINQAGKATRLLKAGSLTPQAYRAAIQEIPANFVKDLQALTQTWKCTECGEENP